LGQLLPWLTTEFLGSANSTIGLALSRFVVAGRKILGRGENPDRKKKSQYTRAFGSM
jgi:hypothetical protein